MKIIKLEEVGSTNDFCKENDGGRDLFVVAKRQSAGKGTKGRSFSSNEGGLYVSVMRHYKNFPADEAFKIMVNACVAVCKTLEAFSVKPRIRWANDVLAGDKKICGTLIENSFSNGKIIRSIVGMGINVNNGFPAELQNIAASVLSCTGRKTPLKRIERTLYRNLKKQFTIGDYKSYIDWFGKSVIIKTAEEEREVTALDVSADGRLIVNWCGNMLEISAAEVSLRL